MPKLEAEQFVSIMDLKRTRANEPILGKTERRGRDNIVNNSPVSDNSVRQLIHRSNQQVKCFFSIDLKQQSVGEPWLVAVALNVG